MKINIKKFVLEALLLKASSVVGGVSLIPILKNFYVSSYNSKLEIISTDMSLSIIAETSLVEIIEDGRAVFPKNLVEIVRSCEAELITMTVSEDKAEIISGTAKWEINLMKASEYPEITKFLTASTSIDTVELSRQKLLNSINFVKSAIAKDTTSRPELKNLAVNDGKLMASNGAVLLAIGIKELIGKSFLIHSVDDLIRVLRDTEVEKLSIGEVETHIVFFVGDDVYILTKQTYKYPDAVNTVIEPARKNKSELVADRETLLKAVNRVRITADPDTSGVILDIKSNFITLSSKDKLGNNASESVNVNYSGADRLICINHVFLINSLKAFKESKLTIRLGIDTKTKKAPLFIEHNGKTCVINQIRL